MITIPKWQYVVIHHSWSVDHDTLDWQGIIIYHTSYRVDGKIVTREKYNELLASGQGTSFQPPWSDVGYHFGIEKINNSIQIVVGRPLNRKGAHCPQQQMNDIGIGLCYIGNYDNAEPDEKMINTSIHRLIIPLMGTYNIPVANIVGHHNYNPQKTCPGTQFDLSRFREKVTQLI